MWGMVRGIVLACCLPVMAAAQSVTGLTIERGAQNVERLHFVTSTAVAPKKIFTLANPDRVVIDLPKVSASHVSLPASYGSGFIQNIRFGQFDATTSRIVVDVAGPAKLVGSLPTAGELLVDIAPVNPALVPTATGTIPSTRPSPVTPQKDKPLIIIDAGHGGQDPGAFGLHQVQEKGITLKFARALKEGLLRTGRYRVALTREDDTYIMLPERVNIARKAKGDLFISLHADSNPRPEARGLSIYTLSETASDEEAAALAERENKSDIISGLDLGTADADVASILIDLTQRETMNKSSLLAEDVVANLHPKIVKLPSTHRFAGFRVLKAPDIPSVLVELGFLSNSTDEQLLQSHEYQTLVVSSLIKAFDRYVADEGL